MAEEIYFNELERDVQNILDNGDNNLTVELSNLSERAYNALPSRFNKENYEVRGVDYVLHISKRYGNA